MFFKKLVFPEFRSIKPISRPIEIAIKSFGLALCVSIDQTHFSINRKSYREFLKIFVFHVFKHCSNFSKHFLSIQLVKASNQFFCCFPPIFLQGFSLPRPVGPYYPSFFIYFQVSCISVMHIWEISNLRNFGFFIDLSIFFQNWLMGFCCGML